MRKIYVLLARTGSSYSVIVGGVGNCIISTTLSQYNFIGGGSFNTISGTYSAILGGQANTVAGACSAILGGSGNTVSAPYSYAGIFGCSVAAVMSCAFHANNFVAQNIPPGAGGGAPPAGAAIGSLYYEPGLGGFKAVYVA